jgi:predicted nucleic acid-binding protein
LIRWLVDTNIILRWSAPADPLHSLAVPVVALLCSRGDQVFVSPQNLIEFWNVATRPLKRNGFGYSVQQAEASLAGIEAFFPIAPDTPDVYREWRHLITTHRVSGVQVHDARLVAVMRVHGLTSILTLNVADFQRYPGIQVVHPQNV